MRASLLLIPLVSAHPLIADSEKRQSGGIDLTGILDLVGPLISQLAGSGLGDVGFGNIPKGVGKYTKKEIMQPVLRTDATRERLWFGPFTLPAFNTESSAKPPLGLPFSVLKMDPASVQINYPISGFCKDCSVLYGKAELFFENSTKASLEHGVYEHHVVVVDLGKPQNFPFYLCPGQTGFLGKFPGSGFIISGNDHNANFFTTPDGAFDSGYLVRDPRLAMQAELVNYRPEPQKVFVTLEYEYLPTIPSPAPADTSVSLFSVTGCKPPDYHRDPGLKVYNMTSDAVPVPMNGYIVNAKGHLHDGGNHITLSLNGNVICDSHAIYGKEKGADAQTWEIITSMEQCTRPVQVRKGDVLQMKSFYDTEKYPPRPTGHSHGTGMLGQADEMGVFFINFAKSL